MFPAIMFCIKPNAQESHARILKDDLADKVIVCGSGFVYSFYFLNYGYVLYMIFVPGF